jgi:alpha-tubulin suppressor-like RCC1 family protein
MDSDHRQGSAVERKLLHRLLARISRRSFLGWAPKIAAIPLIFKARIAKAAGYYNLGSFWKKLSSNPPIDEGATASMLFAWGSNSSGSLGLGDVALRSSPVQVGTLSTWTRIESSKDNTLGRRSNGTLWGWGKNTSGSLGLGDVNPYSSPMQVGTLTDWSGVLALGNQAGAIKMDGTLWTWGLNASGRLGLGDIVNRSSPVQVGTLTDWSNIGFGDKHAVALKSDNTLWAWGNGVNGELGQGDVVARSSPVQVGTLTTWKSAAGGFMHSLATKTDGTLWVWGNAASGELGLGDTVARSSPTQVGTLTNWSKVFAASSRVSYATKTDGTLWAWGINTSGALGDGTIVDRSSPTQIGTLTDWSMVVGKAGFNVTARKTDGTIWTWGEGTSGEQGRGNAVDTSSPIQIGTHTTWTWVGGGGNATPDNNAFGLRT